MAKILEIKSSMVVCSCEAKLYGFIIMGSVKGSIVKIFNGEEEIISMKTAGETFFNVSLAEPVVCGHGITVGLVDSGLVSVSLIFDVLG